MLSNSITRTYAWVAVLTLLLAWGCGGATIQDKTDRTLPDSAQEARFAWADSVINTLTLRQKLRHLCLIPVPAVMDTHSLSHFKEILADGAGGLLLPPAPLDSLNKYVPRLQDSLALPLWTATDIDSAWLAYHDLPRLREVGATDVDTLARRWGKAIAEALAFGGSHMAFVSAARLEVGGFNTPDALGSDPAQVHRLGTQVAKGFRAGGVIPVLRALPQPEHAPRRHIPEYHRHINGLEGHDLLPLRGLLGIEAPYVQSNFIRIPETDTAPAPFSAKLNTLLRSSGDALVFSPPLGGDEMPSAIAPEEAAIRMLLAGTDVLVLRGQARTILDGLEAAVKAGRLPETLVDARLRRVLVQKAGLTRPLALYPGVHPAINLRRLDRIVSTAAIAVVRDDARRLPLVGGLNGTKIALVGFGAQPGTVFQRAMEVYAPVDYFKELGDSTAPKGTLTCAMAAKYDLVVAAIGLPKKENANEAGAPTEREDELGQAQAKLLECLDAKSPLVVVNFGEPARLAGLEGQRCLIQAWHARPSSQTAAGQFLLGAIPANGRLTCQAGDGFCVRDGLPRGGRYRLAYVSPEAVGADPAILLQIDTLIRNAMALGAFPGCQILAAKDGQVFLHKAYGYHSYDRTRPTRVSDLYDVASVTKIAATTLMAMHAYERDTLHLDYPLRYYLKELDSAFVTIKNITPKNLLLHKAGLPPGLPIYKYCVMNDSAEPARRPFYSNAKDSLHTVQIADNLWFNPTYLDSLWEKVRRLGLDTSGTYVYSDVSMFLMKRVLERIAGTTLDRFVDSVFYRPMGLRSMCFLPLNRYDEEKIVPTEHDRWWRNQQVHGHVHDPSTAIFGGVGGQAGLFSNSWDLAAVMQMLLDGGRYAGRQLLSPQTVSYFTARHPGSHRGLGFDMQKPEPEVEAGMVAYSATPMTFGHTGFTGTCAWADPANEIVFVFLSNRVYPSSDNKKINIYRIRQTAQQLVYDALGIGRHQIPEDVLAAEQQDCYPDSLGCSDC